MMLSTLSMARYLEVQPHLLFLSDILLFFSYILLPLSQLHNVCGSKQDLLAWMKDIPPQQTQSRETLDDMSLLKVKMLAVKLHFFASATLLAQGDGSM